MMTHIEVGLRFSDSGYIGKPFWPETNTLINISKDVHPKLGDAKKQAALAAVCEKRGITIEEYKRIEAKSLYPFYTLGDIRTAEIVIPQRVIQSFLNHASMAAPKAISHIAEKRLTFIGVKVKDGYLRTGKTEKNALLFERFVKNEESNQRMFTSDPYIIDFTAKGILLVDEEIIKEGDLKKLIEYGGRMYGIGTARPQGYGRFAVSCWELIDRAAVKEAEVMA
jgi:hypothetical protein